MLEVVVTRTAGGRNLCVLCAGEGPERSGELIAYVARTAIRCEGCGTMVEPEEPVSQQRVIEVDGERRRVRAPRCLIVVDVEADGPCPGDYSMVCFGAVLVSPILNMHFYGQTRPVTERRDPEALAISGFSRADHEGFEEPGAVMKRFDEWLRGISPVFISDNLAFDWQWINWYFWHFLGRNPFGWSGRRIGDIFAGLHRDLRTSWKHLRKTRHTHHPVDDARGNAEALLELANLGMKGILP